MRKTVKSPTVFQSLIPVAVLIVLIGLNVTLLGDETLAGANQMSLLIASGVTACIAIRNGKTWGDILEGIVRTLTGAIPAILILLMIGVLSGTWMLSGIIPAMIHYGLYVLRPEYFLPATVVISALISLATGSSWSTVATVGVALLGIGRTLGFGDPVIAGAIISGAYFGDKVSPLSDTTNLAAAIAGTNLFTHIRYMLYTTLPTIFVTLIIFTILSIGGGKIAADVSVADTQRMITDYYYISPVLFLVPLAAVAMIVFKMPPVPVLFVGSLLGGVMAVVCQPELIDGRGRLPCRQPGDVRDGIAGNGRSDGRFAVYVEGNGRDAEYRLADYHGDDFRRRDGGRTVFGADHDGAHPPRTFDRRTRERDGGNLRTVQFDRIRPVPRHRDPRQNFRQRVPAQRAGSRSAEPDAGRRRYGHLGADPVEYLRRDAGRRAERGDGRLPALRFFLLHQSADVDPVRLAGFAYPQNPAAGRFAGNGKSK